MQKLIYLPTMPFKEARARKVPELGGPTSFAHLSSGEVSNFQRLGDDSSASPGTAPSPSLASLGRFWTAVVLLLTAALPIFFGNLAEQSISPNSDEVIHIRVVQELLEHGRWWQPTHGETPYYNKPPLKLWLSLIPVFVIGEGNLSYRLLDGLAGVGTVLLLLWIARRLFASNLTGVLAGLQLLTFGMLVMGHHGFRRGTQDAFLILLCTAAILPTWTLYSRARRSKLANAAATPPWLPFIALGVLTGAAALTKSISGLLPLVVCAVLWLTGGLLSLVLKNVRYYAAAVFIALLLPSLYFLPHSLFSPGAWERFFVAELYDRAVEGFHNRGDYTYYVRQLWRRNIAGKGILLSLAVGYAVWRALGRKEEQSRFLLIWALVPVALYSIAETRLPWYIAPALPVFALLTARAAVAAYEAACRGLKTGGAAGTMSVALLIFPLAVVGDMVWRGSAIVERIRSVDEQRLPIDVVVSGIARAGLTKSAAFLEGAFDTRANPARGRFNVEGLYVRMLTEHGAFSIPSDALPETLRDGGAKLLFLPLSVLPEQIPWPKAYTVLPAYKTRKHPVLVLSYAETELPGMTSLPDTILFGEPNSQLLFGFGRVRDIGPFKARFAVGPRSAFVHEGNSVMRQRPVLHSLSLGTTGKGTEGKLILTVSVNEREVARIPLEGQAIRSHTFTAPEGTWESGPNVVMLRLTDLAGRSVSPERAGVFYHRFTTRPLLAPFDK